MNLLAFDTSTETLSLAVQHGQHVRTHTGAGGAQASATLIPAALALLAEAGLRVQALDAIVFGRGPGAFTGLRTACAVAQGLAWGAGVPVLPLDTLLAVAEDARQRHGATQVLAVLDARMGEVYAAPFRWQPGTGWAALAPATVAPPEALAPPAGATNAASAADTADTAGGWVLAGHGFATFGPRLPPALAAWPRRPALPTATALLALAPPRLAAGHAVPAAEALPLYIRDKVAQTTAERLAAKAGAPA